jgi:hypothetical protein
MIPSRCFASEFVGFQVEKRRRNKKEIYFLRFNPFWQKNMRNYTETSLGTSGELANKTKVAMIGESEEVKKRLGILNYSLGTHTFNVVYEYWIMELKTERRRRRNFLW